MKEKLNYDVKLERPIIGYMLIGLEDAKNMCTIMNPKWFYAERNVKIFEVLKEQVDDDVTPDIVLACKWLTDKGILGEVGGMEYLAECLDNISTPAHVAQYIKELRQMYYDRQIIISAHTMLQEPTAQNMEKLRVDCFDRDSAGASGIIDVRKSLDVINTITEPRKEGLYELFDMERSDKILCGFTPGNLMTIGARPGVGKTVIGIKMALNFAKRYKEPVLYFSTEMSYEETLMRILSPMTQVAAWKFRKRVFNKETEDITKIFKAAEELSKLKIFVKDKPSPTIEDIRAGILATKCKLVIVDYIQRMRLPKAKMKNEAIEQVMVMLKNLARDLGIMVIVLSQLDRETDKLSGKATPQMADLKGSGAIEAESDTICLMWRKNKKNPHDSKKKLVDEDINGIRPIELIFTKNRAGQSDISVQLVFVEKYVEFREATKDDAPGSTGATAKEKKDDKQSRADKMWKDTEELGSKF